MAPIAGYINALLDFPQFADALTVVTQTVSGSFIQATGILNGAPTGRVSKSEQ